jgi:hypothetical protein
MREEEEDRIGHGSIGLTDIWFFPISRMVFLTYEDGFLHTTASRPIAGLLVEIRRGTRPTYETFLCGRWFLSGLFDGRNSLFTYHGL